MKFRGIIGGDSDCGNGCDDHIDSTVKVLSSICKIAHNSSLIFKIIDDKIVVYCYHTNICTEITGHSLTKCMINKQLFSEYSFVGVSDELNMIVFELRSDTLTQVLRSLLVNMKQIKLKLNRLPDGRPVLTIQVDYPSNVVDSSRSVRHDLNINLIRRQHYYMYDDEHRIQPYHCSLYLPSFKILSATLERLNNMSKYLTISAKQTNNKGVMRLAVEADSILLKTKFSQLDVYNEQNEQNSDNSNQNEINSAKVRIDMSKLSQVFNSVSNIKPEYIRCNLIHSNRANFFFFDNQFNLSVTLPNIEY